MGCRELDISDCFIFSTEKDHFAAHFEYSPFGKIISENRSMPENFVFCFSSEYHDSETGLVYYNYRYYDADMGRWINRDPIGEQGVYNLYGFVGNDGVNRWDRLGLKVTWRIATYTSKEYSDLVGITKIDEVLIVETPYTGIEPDSGGAFYEPNVKFDGNNCRANFIINIEFKGMSAKNYPKGFTVWYLEHYNGGSAYEPSYSSGGLGNIPKEATLAHEKGHAKAFFEILYPKIDAYMNTNYKKKDIYTDTQKAAIKKKVEELLKVEEYQKASANYANKATRSAMEKLKDKFEKWEWAQGQRHRVRIPSVFPGKFKWQDATDRWKTK